MGLQLTQTQTMGVHNNLNLSAPPLAGFSNSVSSAATANYNYNEEITWKLAQITGKTEATAVLLKKLKDGKAEFACKCEDRHKIEQNMVAYRNMNPRPTAETLDIETWFKAETGRMGTALKHGIRCLIKLINTLEMEIETTVIDLSVLQSKVVDEELARWKQEQRKHVLKSQNGPNSKALNEELNLLQVFCEGLANLIWLNRQQLKEVIKLKGSILHVSPSQMPARCKLTDLEVKVTQLLANLVESTFILEKYPPQVVKTNNVIASPSTVRLLIGGQLNLQMSPPQVNVSIISELQTKALLRNDGTFEPFSASGKILNNSGSMIYCHTTRTFTVHFRNMRVSKIQRTTRSSNGDNAVTDEKFCFRYQCQFTIGERELCFDIGALSLPVVVIVHNSQETNALATIWWENAFAEAGRIPFRVPERVTWSAFKQALSETFKACTGRELAENDLQFLGEKISSNSNFYDNHGMVYWTEFCKNNLKDREFTFWQYFYSVMKLTQKHLKVPWMKGYIMGFVSRNQAVDLLSNCDGGTFLLRFSDTVLGSVTITWVNESSASGRRVLSVDPFTSKDFSSRPLANHINDLSQLDFLYPDGIAKQRAFGDPVVISADSSSREGYVGRSTKTTLPGLTVHCNICNGGAGPSQPPASVPPSPQSPHFGPDSPLLYSNEWKPDFPDTFFPSSYEDAIFDDLVGDEVPEDMGMETDNGIDIAALVRQVLAEQQNGGCNC